MAIASDGPARRQVLATGVYRENGFVFFAIGRLWLIIPFVCRQIEKLKMGSFGNFDFSIAFLPNA